MPRWIPFGRPNQFVPLEQVIGANLGALFPGMEIKGYNTFRVTRYSDLELANADDDDDLLTMIEEQVFQRRFAEVVRVEVERGTPPGAVCCGVSAQMHLAHGGRRRHFVLRPGRPDRDAVRSLCR